MIVYQAVPEHASLLEKSLRRPFKCYNELYLCDSETSEAYFYRNLWFDAEIHEFASISQAAKYLRSIGRNWSYFPLHEHRRASLIQEQLPKITDAPKIMPHIIAKPLQLGVYALLDKTHMLLAPRSQSPFVGGIPKFQENKIDPPSRAYLKLWEALCVLGRTPTAADHCLDLGACPGGWTWVLSHYAQKVTAVDRSPLHESLMRREKIKFIQGNAFTLEPEDFPELDWLVSDVICYPDKLLATVLKWVAAKPNLTMICTIKFQGEADYEVVKEFLKIPGSHVHHLFHNKHELTWIKD